MRILYVVPYAPTRIRTRPFHFIRALVEEGHAVTVATLSSSGEDRQALAELAAIAGDVVSEGLSRGRSLWNCVCALPTADPLQARFSWHPRLASRLRHLAISSPFDVVHVEHLRGVRYGLVLGSLRPGARPPALVWDSVDCISTLFRDASKDGPSRRVRLAARFELGRTQRCESAAVSRFDLTIVSSEQDRLDLRELEAAGTGTAASARIEVVGNGVDLDYFSPPPPPAPRDPLTLVVTGKMSYHANATAVIRLVKDVMPLIWSELPGTRLWVVGKDPPSELLGLGQPWQEPAAGESPAGGNGSRILVTGTVSDLRPFLRRATLALAPIQYGVGIQNKILEAMACGTPVVATARAAAGLDARPGVDLAVATGASEFARTAIALLKDRTRREVIGRAGRGFVERQHSWRSVAGRLADLYRSARA
jgi:glycosyltransferase involved in cell wall biosynthesis